MPLDYVVRESSRRSKTNPDEITHEYFLHGSVRTVTESLGYLKSIGMTIGQASAYLYNLRQAHDAELEQEAIRAA
jgi:hypothetical protein